ncbi:hypothetical protein Chor_005590 [Crotalus horridus]
MRLRLALHRRGFWLGSSRGSEDRSFRATGSGIAAGSPAFAGLSGFFPLHPMSITNAERLRKKKAQEAAKAAEKGEEEDLEEKREHQQN